MTVEKHPLAGPVGVSEARIWERLESKGDGYDRVAVLGIGPAHGVVLRPVEFGTPLEVSIEALESEYAPAEHSDAMSDVLDRLEAVSS